MARRLSYASVVSGTAAPSPPNLPQPTVSGSFSHLITPNQLSDPPAADISSRASSYPARLSDPQYLHGIGLSLPESWERGQIPPYSNSFGHWDDTLGQWRWSSRSSHFFVPSYLQGSRYIERLEGRQRARLAARKEVTKSHRSSNAGSLSTTPSSVNLHKMVPSHRGMTHDIIERAPPTPEENPSPLPSRWSPTDKFSGLDIHGDGTEVKFTGAIRSQDEAAAIRTDYSIPKECGVYYYEVTVLGKGKEGLVGVGFSGPKVSLNRIPGWETESWAYHGDDGSTFCQTHIAKAYGPKFGSTDVIGCGLIFRTSSVFFTKNGTHLGTAFREVKARTIFPTVGMKKPGEHIKANFGREPFVFDIDNLVQKEKSIVQKEIDRQNTSNLSSKGESVLLQQLVVQYLMHDGYMETAKAFAHEVHNNESLLQAKDKRTTEFQWHEDTDAVNRQRIRTAILDGDVDRALKLTAAFYPNVLRENESIYFKLRCRKFIEMIRKCTDLQPGFKGKRNTMANGHSTVEDDVFNGHMELDHQPNGHDDFDGMDIEEDAISKEMDLMKDALQYGQELQREFKDDPRREVKQALENTFALIAYADARESSLAPMLEVDGRIPVAEELNSAILVSLGKASTSALERMYQQTETLVGDLSEDGGAGAALVNLRDDYFRCQ